MSIAASPFEVANYCQRRHSEGAQFLLYDDAKRRVRLRPDSASRPSSVHEGEDEEFLSFGVRVHFDLPFIGLELPATLGAMDLERLECSQN